MLIPKTLILLWEPRRVPKHYLDGSKPIVAVPIRVISDAYARENTRPRQDDGRGIGRAS